MGFAIKPGFIKMDLIKIKVVRYWPEPINVKEVKGFLGFINYYRKFIKDFGKMVLLFIKFTKVISIFEWNDKQRKTFFKIKERILKEPVLRITNTSKLFEVETDTSNFAIGV